MKNLPSFPRSSRTLLAAAVLSVLAIFTLPSLLFAIGPVRKSEKEEKDKTIFLAPVPPVVPDTIPVPAQNALIETETSADGSKDAYEIYNTFPRDLNLGELESKRFVRGPAVISPDRREFTYSEVLYTPFNRQTFSRLYRVRLDTPSENASDSDDGENVPPSEVVEPPSGLDRFDPDKNLQHREVLTEIGYDKIKRFDFKTLTIVDWSATGRRLLVKEKSGVLHVGLRTSDIIIYDEKVGTVTIYPEVRRIIQHYWRTEGNLPNLNRLTWELTPLGWEPGSDSVVLLKAWALDSREKKFLGLWRYDVDARHADLINTQNESAPVAANGLLAKPAAPPKPLRRPPSQHSI